MGTEMERDACERNKTISETDRAVLYLVGCALNDRIPDKDVYAGSGEGAVYEGTAGKDIYNSALRHSVISMVATALEKNGYAGIDKDMAGRIRQAAYKAVRKNILLNAEREQILSYFESEGIGYLPLKGVILQNLYPESGMRQMTDNDILIHESDTERVRKFMEDRGFTFKKYRIHDSYYKEPVYNYEMHIRLFTDAEGKGLYADYYKDVWDRAVLDEGKKYGYRMSNEDFYVYMTAHAAKHYDAYGTGIRTLADFYVAGRELGCSIREVDGKDAWSGDGVNAGKGSRSESTGREVNGSDAQSEDGVNFAKRFSLEDMDREYVKRELAKLGLEEFEEKMRRLAYRVFGEPLRAADFAEDVSEGLDKAAGLDLEEQKMLAYILASGTYGIKEHRIPNLMKKNGLEEGEKPGKKLIYFLKRLFPNQKTLVSFYPAARYKILIPFVWVFRIIRGLVLKHKNIRDELDFVRRS